MSDLQHGLSEKQLEWLRDNMPGFRKHEEQARAARKHAEDTRKEMEKGNV